MGTTSFWSGSNPRLEACIQSAFKDHGINVFDTAEMYGNGRSEAALGRAIRGLDREQMVLLDKILRDEVQKKSFRKSLNQSLQHLGTDYIDLYLLHWREKADLQLLVDEMEEARAEGLIREWGVSNFSVEDMQDLLRCRGGEGCFTNQVFYCLYERGAEYDLFPLLREYGIRPMSYSSLGSNYYAHPDIHRYRDIVEACEAYGITPEAWMLQMNVRQGVLTLFQTSSLQHLRENTVPISDETFEAIRPVFEAHFPAPIKAKPLVKI